MKKLILFFLLSCGFYSTANAQIIGGSADIVRAINQLREAVIAKIDGTVDLYIEFALRLNPNQIPTMKANEAQATAAYNAVSGAMSRSGLSSKKSLIQSGDKETLRLADIPAQDYFVVPPTAYSFNPRNIEVIKARGNQAVNFDAFLTPTAYNNFDAAKIENNPSWNFIQFVSGLYQPVAISLTDQTPKLTQPQIEDIQKSPNYRKYRAAVRAFVAAQSIGASNLYQLMGERIPQPDLGKAAGMNTNDASLVELQRFLATRRSQNPEWYKAMTQAPPATIQRETLYVLAEIRDQLFQLQQQNERLLATMSVLQLQQNNQSARVNLIQLEQKVDAQIKEAQGVTAPEATPPTNLQIPGIPQ